jgi:hypothetical protein
VAQQLSGQEFQIGLTMAGAISAGAYSAGVLDFFIQALEAWEKARLDPALADQIPNHRVGIKVITGASAGAITGALGVVGLAQGIEPKQFGTALKQQVTCVLPCLYDAWVVKPGLVSATGGADFLQTDDLDKGKVVSLLNSGLLDQIRANALKLGPRGQALPYISRTLHVYMTLTNLRGVPYGVTFEGGNFIMMSHGDRVHYSIGDLGSWQAGAPFADDDNTKTLAIGALFEPNGPSQDWQDFTGAAVASAAFPAGLAPRTIATFLPQYNERSWPMSEWHLLDDLRPKWPSPWGDDQTRSFSFLSVDGGVVNNDPFDYAHFTLMDNPPDPNPRNGQDADRAVIMIDPFPEPPDFPSDGQPDQALVSVLKAFVPALVNQARFKPTELFLAASQAIYSRYMIAPSRPKPNKSDELYAIACGLLGGFGGFLSRPFREHDFILGQRNCQKFLSSSFALPNNNKIIQQWPQAARNNPDFVAPAAPGQPPHFCIVPLIGDARIEIAAPLWPQMSHDEFSALQARIAQRLDKVVQTLAASHGPGGVAGWLLGRIYSLKRSDALEFIKFTILADLVKRNQIQGWDLPNAWKQAPSIPLDGDDVRMVLAALLDPSLDLRNAAGIAAATRLDVTKVTAILVACQAETGAPYEIWQSSRTDKSGAALYALASRKPGWFTSLPGIRQASDWASPPQVDPPGL